MIDAVYLPKGFGNTVTVEHDDGTCQRYTHLDKKLVKKGNRVVRGQQIGTVGKGAKNIYARRICTWTCRAPEPMSAPELTTTRRPKLTERFIDPLSRIPASN